MRRSDTTRRRAHGPRSSPAEGRSRWRWVARGLGALALAGVPACAPASAAKAPVAVMLLGDAASAARAREALSASPPEVVEIRFAEPPRPRVAPGSTGAVESALAAARTSYVNADGSACLAAIGDDSVLATALQEGRRSTAARLLFWRVACRVVAGEREEAAREARVLASLGLDVPPDAEAASPEVEAAIGRALNEVAAAGVVPLKVTANGGAEVIVDGQFTACAAPCSIDVRRGVHFVSVAGDGLTPAVRRVTVPEESEVSFTLAPASPDLAAQQWTGRYAGTPRVDSNASVTLLARSVRARNFALLFLDEGQSPGRLRGALAVNGGVPVRAERTFRDPAGAAAEAPPLLRELLIDAKVLESRPLHRNVWFWVAVAAAAGLAAGVTAGVLYEPPTRTEVQF